jgi:squalene-hopene/tetraprenyl-beta-curcumene cyclase
VTATGQDGTVRDGTGRASTGRASTGRASTGQDSMGPDATAVRVAASAAVQRVSQILLARQDGQGWWSGRSAGEVTLEAEALLVAEVLGIRTAEVTSAVAQQIRSLQLADGRWTGNGEPAADGGGPEAAGDLSASVLAYLALRLAGDSADAYHMALAAGWIRDAGGAAAVGVLARTWLALFGLAEWSDVPVPVPELSYLPGRQAASRPAAVALAIIGTMRPIRPLPIDLTELRPVDADELAGAPRRARLRVAAPTAAHAAALRPCGLWLISWQHRSGLPAARRPSWPCSLVALYLLGYPLDHPVLAKGLSWLSSVTAQPRQTAGSAVAAAARQPPVLETTLAVEALADSGAAADNAALVAAASWLLLQRIEGPAHGPGPTAGPGPSGWSFGRDGYPVAADTARVLVALSRVRLPGLTGRPAIRNAVRWLIGIQSRDGSWSGSPTVTAHAVRALATQGGAQPRAIRRGVVWLLRQQRPDGSWAGQDVDSDLVATTAVLPALIAAGVLTAKPPIRLAIGWLLGQQNSDAGWAPGRRPEASDAQATARAVAALLTAGGPESVDAIDRGAGWLVRAQQADGGSAGDRPRGRSASRRRGTLVPGLLLPLSALGRFVAASPNEDAAGAVRGGALHAGAVDAGAVDAGAGYADGAVLASGSSSGSPLLPH